MGSKSRFGYGNDIKRMDMKTNDMKWNERNWKDMKEHQNKIPYIVKRKWSSLTAWIEQFTSSPQLFRGVN